MCLQTGQSEIRLKVYLIEAEAASNSTGLVQWMDGFKSKPEAISPPRRLQKSWLGDQSDLAA